MKERKNITERSTADHCSTDLLLKDPEAKLSSVGALQVSVSAASTTNKVDFIIPLDDK